MFHRIRLQICLLVCMVQELLMQSFAPMRQWMDLNNGLSAESGLSADKVTELRATLTTNSVTKWCKSSLDGSSGVPFRFPQLLLC